MLVTEIYKGSGIGNQLWNYVVTRLIAEANGYEFGIQCPERWKGAKFMPADMGKEVIGGSGPEGGPPTSLPEGINKYYAELRIPHPNNGWNMGFADPGLLSVSDNTKIEGTMQKMSYIKEHRSKIMEWLKYDESLDFPQFQDDCCIIQFRGGDYLTGASALPPEYYSMAMDWMRHITNNANLKFYVVTDDPGSAQKYIPDAEVIGSAITEEKDELQGSIGWYKYPGGPIGIDYSILNKAKYVIMSASTFCFWPVWLNDRYDTVISPKYWFDWNTSDGWWRPDDSIVDDWMYLDRQGGLDMGKDCRVEYDNYKNTSIHYG